MQYPEFHHRWQWELQSDPERLWPLVADTNRFNRDTGLPALQRSGDAPLRNARRGLRFSILGINVEWVEEPFEWVRPHRFGVVRHYRSGLIATLRVEVQLLPAQSGGTLLVYESWLKLRNLLGVAGIPFFMAANRRRFASVFRRYDEEAQERAHPSLHPSGIQFVSGGRQRLAGIRERLAQVTGAGNVVALLCEVVGRDDDLLVARLRPFALADAWGAPRNQVLDVCLHATRSGLLVLQWDLLCPMCRGPKASSNTLSGIREQVHCDTCNIDFTANFERSVELTFTPSPSVRQTTVQERRDLVASLLDAVYVDIKESRSVVGIRPRPAFKSLFEAVTTAKGSGVELIKNTQPPAGEPGAAERCLWWRRGRLGLPVQERFCLGTISS
jgi:hypothetical protein